MFFCFFGFGFVLLLVRNGWGRSHLHGFKCQLTDLLLSICPRAADEKRSSISSLRCLFLVLVFVARERRSSGILMLFEGLVVLLCSFLGVLAALSHRVSVTCFRGFSRRWSCRPLCRGAGGGGNKIFQKLCQLCCGLEWFQQLNGATPFLARSLQDCCLEGGTRLALSYCRVKDVFSTVLEEKGLSKTRAGAICRLAVAVQVCYDNGIRAGGGRWSCFCVSRQ